MEPKAFTLCNPNIILRALVTICGISKAYDPAYSKGPAPKIMQYNGLWDTGATGSMITEKIVKELGLIPVRQIETHHAQGTSINNLYYVNIALPNGIVIPNVPVADGKLIDTDVLIGMDIISLGDFSITNRNGGTVFSFQIPSTHEYDFVKQIKNSEGSKAKKKKNKKK